MKPDDVIKIVEYIKKQAGYNGDIFINVNVNSIPIEWIKTYIENYDGFYVEETKATIQYMLEEWERENADL